MEILVEHRSLHNESFFFWWCLGKSFRLWFFEVQFNFFLFAQNHLQYIITWPTSNDFELEFPEALLDLPSRLYDLLDDCSYDI